LNLSKWLIAIGYWHLAIGFPKIVIFKHAKRAANGQWLKAKSPI